MTERNGSAAAEAGALPTDQPHNRRRDDRPRAALRIAAVGDFHSAESSVGAYRTQFARVNGEVL